MKRFNLQYLRSRIAKKFSRIAAYLPSGAQLFGEVVLRLGRTGSELSHALAHNAPFQGCLLLLFVALMFLKYARNRLLQEQLSKAKN